MSKRLMMGATSALMLGACASTPTLTAEQCASGDWFALGKADGAAGQSMTAINDEFYQCKPHGIEPDMDAYKAGRAEGLQTYCVPTSLLESSLKLQGDPFSCDPMTPEMTTAFETGRDTRIAVQRYQRYKQQYDQLTQQKEQINQEGARLSQQYNQTTDENLKRQIATRLNQLTEQLKAVEAEIVKADPVMQEEDQKYQTAVQTYETYQTGLTQ